MKQDELLDISERVDKIRKMELDPEVHNLVQCVLPLLVREVYSLKQENQGLRKKLSYGWVAAGRKR